MAAGRWILICSKKQRAGGVKMMMPVRSARDTRGARMAARGASARAGYGQPLGRYRGGRAEIHADFNLGAREGVCTVRMLSLDARGQLRDADLGHKSRFNLAGLRQSSIIVRNEKLRARIRDEIERGHVRARRTFSARSQIDGGLYLWRSMDGRGGRIHPRKARLCRGLHTGAYPADQMRAAGGHLFK